MGSNLEYNLSESETPVKVSILCNTYNHERYIARALDGFIMQRTDFAFEICIHDDASTDSTSKIIRRYELRYPHLFRCIYQTENQYSKGIGIMVTNLKRANGDYIAVCEGDDEWTDPLKLQKQVDYLDNHPNCSLVGHATLRQNAQLPFIKKVWRASSFDRTLTMNEIIANKGVLFPHNSIMFRKRDVGWPTFFEKLGVADVARTIQAALCGDVYFMKDVMSKYRVGVRHSWTERVRLNSNLITKHYQREVDFYHQLNIYTYGQYQDSISEVIEKLELLILIKNRHFALLKESSYARIINKQSFRFKLSMAMEQYIPPVYTMVQFIRFWSWV